MIPLILKKYAPYLKPYKAKIILGIVALVLTNALGVSIPWMMKGIIDALGKQSTVTKMALNGFLYQLLAILAVISVMLVTRIVSRFYLLGMGRYIDHDIRQSMFRHLLAMPMSYFAVYPVGELMSRLTNDITALRYFIGGGLLLGFNTVFAFSSTLIMMTLLSWPLSLSTLLIYPLIFWTMSRLSREVKEQYLEVQDILGDISTVAQENIAAMTVIQGYAKEAIEAERFQVICHRYFLGFKRLIQKRIWLFLIMAMASGAGLLIILLVGGIQVINRQLTLGDYIAYTLYLERLTFPTLALGWTITIIQQGLGALERIDQVLSTKTQPLSTTATPENVVPETTLSRSPHIAPNIQIKALTFWYDNPYLTQELTDPPLVARQPLAEVSVLKNITLNIPAGSFVALVGPVGAGKTTLLNILPRLYEPPPQTVFLNEEDITALSLESLRASMVLMSQQSVLFSTSVLDNIRFGNPQASEEEAVYFSEVAAVRKDIEKLPFQFESIVGERGLALSGGQRQRVSLARTLLVNPPMLLLDDPFSNIDAETERQIIATLQERHILKNKTTLIATHRFSVIQHVDWIVLMDQGHIVATGSHEALLQSQELYQKLFHQAATESSLEVV